MLTNLQIKNFAIIDEIEIEFDDGMTVLTGETGAGKSILVDALGLVLGERGGSSLVRRGTKRAEISAIFDIAQTPLAASWLEENALDSDGECLLRRAINADGRSRAFINGNAVPLQSLKTLGELLLDIHGQHFHQSLGRPAVQQDLLDHFASAQALRTATESAFKEWQKLATELAELEAADADRASRLDLLAFQTNELEMLDVQPGETNELLGDRRRLQHSGRLAEGVSTIMQSIYESDSGSAQSLVADACQTLDSLSELDDQLVPMLTLLKEANIQITEAAESLRRYGDSLDMDPVERDRVGDRLDAIQTLARKHRVDAIDLPQLQERLKNQLHDIQHAEERGVVLQERTHAAESKYRKSAMKLSKARHKAAAEFSKTVTATMADLGMNCGGSLIDRDSRMSVAN
jgi:DNA repair protein RecN (Recombination protein N)